MQPLVFDVRENERKAKTSQFHPTLAPGHANWTD